ncbi:hypothetical protein LB516_20110 [Mesorhizobium sp. CO1-1-7]|uniref:glycosyltransferase family 1 protein n=1 Tax=unclassified Mesorhizobium TaxID=325217 RepID=UPI001127E7E4|nr:MULTISPECIES: glycosyltransferase family 1 protein [unclassified Mesorhizobium]MBZ9747558.1 hypothetical protein [Mesorhizobium sp. CO1-1-7]TPL99802.1 glycosyltransferase family 1 protein [Mesorhizobium sp. B2-3-10]
MATTVWIVSPPNYVHSRAFDEVAVSLCAAFRALGQETYVVHNPTQLGDTTIVLGTNLLHLVPLPQQQLILFNLEQVSEPSTDSMWMKPEYISLLKRYPVWDYSEANVVALASMGVQATFCGIGYMPELTRIAPSRHEDIDVLFFGAFNEHRNSVLNRIEVRGANVKRIFDGIYGDERDTFIARSKIVLNLHYYGTQLFEIVRVSYLLANRKCVVSERGCDSAAEAPLRNGVAFACADDIPEVCMTLLAHREARSALAQEGFEAFSARSQVDFVRKAMRQTQVTYYG